MPRFNPFPCVIFYLTALACHGQGSPSFASGWVKDEKNRSPIIYANVYLKSNPQYGGISNEQGKFKLLLPDQFTGDTLVVSFVGYETKKVLLAQSNISDSVRIFLKESQIMLNEVVVLGSTTLTFLKEAARITSEKCVSPAILNTYYREFVSKNGHFTKFADGMVDYYVESRESKRANVQVRIRESRAKTQDVELETPTPGGNFDIQQQLDVESLPYFYDAQRKLQYVLERGDNGDFYDFDLYEFTQDGSEFYKVVFTPKKEIGEMLFVGTFLIDKQTSLISSVHYTVPESHRQYAKVHKLPFGFRVKEHAMDIYVQYQPVGDGCHLKFVKVTASLHVFDKNGLDIMHVFSNEMLVNRVDDQNTAEFKPDEVWRKKSIQKRGNDYSTNFWERQQVVMATEAEEAIIRSLNDTKPSSN